jgi:hypothetical protein
MENSMIISHKYRYLFVELPHTASTAMCEELCDKYAHYYEFLNAASAEEKAFFVFSGIRNPLDETVSVYFKLKGDHKGAYTNPKYWRSNGGYVSRKDLRRFRFIQRNDADFPTFFRTFYRIPYDNWSRLAHHRFDFVIRFENIQDDFAKVLRLLGIAQVRPLPVVNRTTGKRDDFLAYYTPEIVHQARWVFGPFLDRWGYRLPPEWGDQPIPWSSQVLFRALAPARKELLWGPLLGARTASSLRRLL